MGNDVALERRGGSMQAAVEISERVRASADTAPPLVVFCEAGAFALVPGFLVQLLKMRAHARQFLTSHAASISQSPGGKTDYGRNLMEYAARFLL